MENKKVLLLSTLVLALFVAFMEYDTFSLLGISHGGLSTLLIAAASIVYYFIMMKRMKIRIGGIGILYLAGLALAAIATFLSDDDFMAFINKWLIVLLMLNLLIHSFVQDKDWGIREHFAAGFKAVFGGLAMIDAAPRDFGEIREESGENGNSQASKIAIGVLISIPLLVVILSLLCSADAVFADIMGNLIPNFNFGRLMAFVIITAFVFFLVYSVAAYLMSGKFQLREKTGQRHSALTAITIGVLISIVYGAFSVIQFVYLFGRHALPAGYTYASYAKEGVFQLMWLSILNLIIVLCGIVLFEKHNLLRFLLTFISACTYLMIVSASYRLWQYVNIYQGLTRRRIWGIWGLVTVSVCFIGVIVCIYKENFRLYRFGLISILVTYLLLAFLKPDYVVAKVNMELLPEMIASEYDEKLIDELGLDALPVVEKYDSGWLLRRGFFEGDPYAAEGEQKVLWKNLNLSELRGRNLYLKQYPLYNIVN